MARLRGNKWQGDAVYGVGENGKPKRHRITFNTEVEALKFEANPASYFEPKLTIEQLFRSCFDVEWKNSKDAKDAYRIVEELIDLLGRRSDPSTITGSKVQELLKHWIKQGLSPKRINRKLAKLRKCVRYCMNGGHLDKTPPGMSSLSEGKGRIRFLTIQEQSSLRGHLEHEHSKHLFDFLLYTGCRVGEAYKLKWADCHDDRVLFLDRKSGKDGAVPLVQKSYEALMWSRKQGHLRPWTARSYRSFMEDWTQAREKAGLADDEDVTPHVLRHTCCSRLVMGGDPELTKDGTAVHLVRAKEWMGHAHVDTTMLYAHLGKDALFEIAATAKPELDSAFRGRQNAVTKLVPNVPDVTDDLEQGETSNLMKVLGFS